MKTIKYRKNEYTVLKEFSRDGHIRILAGMKDKYEFVDLIEYTVDYYEYSGDLYVNVINLWFELDDLQPILGSQESVKNEK
jgi:uncharacterized lipoprotein YehR (DUF1307 family)